MTDDPGAVVVGERVGLDAVAVRRQLLFAGGDAAAEVAVEGVADDDVAARPHQVDGDPAGQGDLVALDAVGVGQLDPDAVGRVRREHVVAHDRATGACGQVDADLVPGQLVVADGVAAAAVVGVGQHDARLPRWPRRAAR